MQIFNWNGIKTFSFKVCKELKSFSPKIYKAIEALAIKRGSEAGLQKAEAFSIIRKIWQKCLFKYLSYEKKYVDNIVLKNVNLKDKLFFN